MAVVEEEVIETARRFRQAFLRCSDTSPDLFARERWFVEELARAGDARERLRAWAALAYKTANQLARRQCPSAAFRLARLAHAAALRILPDEPDAKHRHAFATIAFGALGAAGHAASARSHPLGRAVVVARMVDCYRQLREGDAALVAVAVEGVIPDLIERGRIAMAEALINSVPEAVAAAHPNWTGVADKVGDLLKAPWAERRTRDNILARLRLDAMRLIPLDDVELRNLAGKFLGQLEQNFDPAIVLELGKALNKKATDLGDADPDAPLRIEAMELVREALDTSGNGGSRTLPRLKAIEAHFVRTGSWDDVATCRLTLGRVLDHIGNRREAADHLAAAIDAQARLALDAAIPALVAGIAESLRPYYEALVNVLLDDGRAREALLAAEHCKAEVWRRVRNIPSRPLVQQIALDADLAHFVSWFVTDEGLAIFWADSHGMVQATRTEISRDRLEAAIALVHANGWRPVGLFAPSNARAIAALSPLLAPLSSAVMSSDAPLTVAPDGILHNVPWHLLEVAGVPLIRRRAIRTVLSLDHRTFVERARDGADGPALLMVVPAANEHNPTAWAAWGDELGLLLARAGMPPLVMSGALGTLDAFVDGLAAPRLHVRCHGHFPEGREVTASAALRDSGLLLAMKVLPTRAAGAPLASPAAVLARCPPAHASLGEVVLEACVSGLVHDGAAGDPVGMPWVLALVGARRVVAAHWNVATKHAEAFFRCYYEETIERGVSAVEAHRAATLEVLDRFGPAAAAFRLLGDDR